MKKFLGFIVAAAALALAAGFGAKWATAQQSGEGAAVVDSLNPLVQEGTVYVKTTKPTRHDDHGAPIYVQTAASADGHTRPIEFLGMKQLASGRYLALTAKGAYVKTYTAVPASAVPTKAIAALD